MAAEGASGVSGRGRQDERRPPVRSTAVAAARSGVAIVVVLVVSAAVGVCASGFTSQALGRPRRQVEVPT